MPGWKRGWKLMKRVPVKRCKSQSKLVLLGCLLTLMVAGVTLASEQQDESAELEELFEFLGSFEDEPEEWNEFFDLAAEGLPPEFGEEDDE